MAPLAMRDRLEDATQKKGSVRGTAKTMQKGATSADATREALDKLVAPAYVSLAFTLPPFCTTTFWQTLKEEIRAKDPHPYSDDLEGLMSFLGDFFSQELLMKIEGNLQHLADSVLGPGYAWRKGKAVFGCRVVDDIVEEQVDNGGALSEFLGVAIDASEGGKGKQPSEEGRLERQDKNMEHAKEDQDSRSDYRGRGRGRIWRGGRKPSFPDDTLSVSEQFFISVPMIVIDLPAFTTPQKLGRPHQVSEKQVREAAIQRRHTIAERSSQFVNHPKVERIALYNTEQLAGSAMFYHGTRRPSWESSFKKKGLDPPDSNNEFFAGPAFYLSNSPAFAFEQPLHNHPGKQEEDFVAVMEFKVEDIQVLYGEKWLPGSRDLLKVLWFETPSDEWKRFCEGNLQKQLKKEAWDVVIGPCCKPVGNGNVTAIHMPGVQLIQIALCSKRSLLWMETCLRRVYLEQRG